MAELRAVDERTDTSDAGVQFISEFEGFYAEPYNDPAGFATVGFGHLLGYRPVSANDRKAIWIDGQETPGRLTQDEARRLLARELSQTYEPPVRALFLDGGPLAGKFEQSLFDALVSFAYNLGPGAVTPGTSGFETVGRAIQSGSRNGIADSLLLYDRAGGQQLPGLTRRRRAERRLIRAGNYSTTF
jgi:lysozyme